MLTPVLVISFTGAIVLAILAVIGRRLAVDQRRLVEESKSWPTVEATIQRRGSVALGRNPAPIPCLYFSYVVDDEYYSGSIALFAYGDRADDLPRQMINRKIDVSYDPSHPSQVFILDKTIDGCEVRQLSD